MEATSWVMKTRFANTTFESVSLYIDYCCKRLQSRASEFCQILDIEIAPIVFVIAVNCAKKSPAQIIHISPDPPDYNLLSEETAKLKELFQQLENPMVGIVDSRPIVARRVMEAHFEKASIVHNRVIYSSEAAMIEEFAVFTICSLNALVLNNRHSLIPKNNAVVSLIDAAIKTFLKATRPFFVYELDSTPFSGGTSLPSSYEILRNAGKGLLSRISFKLPPSDQMKEKLPVLRKRATLFEDINGISRMKYENEKASGAIVIADRNHPNLEILLEFRTPVWTNNLRAARKLIEMSDEEISLLYWDGDFYGLGQINSEYDITSESMFVIRIQDHYTWSLYHGHHNMMTVSYEQPRLVKDEKVDYIDDFRRDISGEFAQLDTLDKEQLVNLFGMALEQTHGTMLVISDKAQEESTRLKTQSTQIKPSVITGTVMRKITAIDGAVMLDPAGICYSIGVILDGTVNVDEGDSARGARYNAAIKYLSYCRRSGIKCLIAVFSEDGMVNIFSTSKGEDGKREFKHNTATA